MGNTPATEKRRSGRRRIGRRRPDRGASRAGPVAGVGFRSTRTEKSFGKLKPDESSENHETTAKKDFTTSAAAA